MACGRGRFIMAPAAPGATLIDAIRACLRAAPDQAPSHAESPAAGRPMLAT